LTTIQMEFTRIFIGKNNIYQNLKDCKNKLPMVYVISLLKHASLPKRYLHRIFFTFYFFRRARIFLFILITTKCFRSHGALKRCINCCKNIPTVIGIEESFNCIQYGKIIYTHIYKKHYLGLFV